MGAKNLDSQIYDVVMIAMTILGVVVNISAIVLLQRKNRSSMFHSLLKVGIFEILQLLATLAKDIFSDFGSV